MSVYVLDHQRMTDSELLAYLGATSDLLYEVGDPYIPYDPHEWAGVPRQQQWADLSSACDALISECEHRGLDWYEAYWGEPRKRTEAPS